MAPRNAEPDRASLPSLLIVLAGAWLIVSPWIVGYEDGDPWWIPMLFGAFVAVAALAHLAKPRGTRFLTHLNVAAGISLFLTGFGIPDSSQAAWNVWVLGAIVFGLAVLSLAEERRAPPAQSG